MKTEGMGSVSSKQEETNKEEVKHKVLTEKEFELKLKKFYPIIVNYCQSFFKNKSEASISAEDIAQETFIKANKSYKNFKGEFGDASFVSWLKKIAFNTFVESTRVRENSNKDKIEDQYNITDSSLTAEEELILKEKKEEILGLIDKLIPSERSVLKMNFSLGVGPKEISEMTGKNEGTVKGTLSKARQSLLRMLGKNKKE